jgi:hypothetical protein
MNVGIYFKVSREFLIDAVPVEAGEVYGEAICHSGHYDYHENLRPTEPVESQFKAHDYDYYPRGRVVFFPGRKTFILYADPCLTPDDISQVKTLFGLEGQIVEVADDEHYRCAGCNKYYME